MRSCCSTGIEILQPLSRPTGHLTALSALRPGFCAHTTEDQRKGNTNIQPGRSSINAAGGHRALLHHSLFNTCLQASASNHMAAMPCGTSLLRPQRSCLPSKSVAFRKSVRPVRRAQLTTASAVPYEAAALLTTGGARCSLSLPAPAAQNPCTCPAVAYGAPRQPLCCRHSAAVGTAAATAHSCCLPGRTPPRACVQRP